MEGDWREGDMREGRRREGTATEAKASVEQYNQEIGGRLTTCCQVTRLWDRMQRATLR